MRYWSKKNVTRRWQVKTGSIDVIGVEADSPMEAATVLFEQLNDDSKINTFYGEDNRLYNVGMLVECIDMDRYKKDPENNTFFLLTSQVFANAGLHHFCKDMELIEKVQDEEERL